jgi:UDP-glucuronate decarboxylase
VNIGNPWEFTILEFAKMVVRLSGTKGKLIFKPLPVDDPKQRQPDIGLAKRILHWQPEVPLELGLAETIAWFKERGEF